MLRRWVSAVAAAWCVSFGLVEGADAPDKQLKATLSAVAAGNLDAGWDHLPASYQKDVEGLIHDFGGQVDGTVWNKSFATLGNAVKLLKEKKKFILASPLLKGGAGPVDAQKVGELYDPVVKLLDAVATSDLRSTKTLKSFSVKAFLKTTGKELVAVGKEVAALAPNGEDALEKFEGLENVKVSVVEVEDDEATLKFEVPDEDPKEEDFVKVEGKWIPADLAEGWEKNIADARAKLPALKIPEEQKAQVVGVISMVDGVIESLLEADSQETFDKTVAGVAATFGGGKPAAPKE